MTSAEYAHTLQDIIGLPVPFADLLPIDLEGASGFTNDQAALTIGESEMEAFLKAAHRAARSAISTASYAGSPNELVFKSTEGRFTQHNPSREQLRVGTVPVVEFDRHWHTKNQKLYYDVKIDSPGIYRITVRAATNLAGDAGRFYIKNLGLKQDISFEALVEQDAHNSVQANETVIADFEDRDALSADASHKATFDFVEDVPKGSAGQALKTTASESANATRYFGTGFAIPTRDFSKTGQISFWIKTDIQGRFNIQLHSAGNRISVLPFSTTGAKKSWQKVSAPIASFSAASWASGEADLSNVVRFQVTALQNGPFDGKFISLDNLACGPRRPPLNDAEKTPRDPQARGALSFSINDSAPDQSPGVVIEDEQLRDYSTYVYLDKGVQEIGIAHEELRVPFVEAPPEYPLTPLPSEQFTRDSHEIPVPVSVFRPIAFADLQSLSKTPLDAKESEPLIRRINLQSRLLYQYSYRPAIYYRHQNVPEWVANTFEFKTKLDRALEELAELVELPIAEINRWWSSWGSDEYRNILDDGRKFFEFEKRTRVKHVRTYAPVVLEHMILTGPLTPEEYSGPDQTLVDVVQEPNNERIQRWVADLLTRTLSREATSEEQERYLRFYNRQIDSGMPAKDAIIQTMAAALVSPKVMYRQQNILSPSGSRLDSLALDSRLAAWLWIGSPVEPPPSDLADSEQAIGNRLDQMVDSARFDRFADAFARQWLRLDRVGREVVPVHDLYPKFSQHLAKDMRREAAMLIARVFRDDLSLLKLIDDDYVYLNERLARHYGIAGVRGEDFRLVKIDGQKSGGLLSTAALLTATSSGVRPSPVQRG